MSEYLSMKTFIEISFYMLRYIYEFVGRPKYKFMFIRFSKILQFRDITHDQSKYFHFNLINHRVCHDSCHETFSIERSVKILLLI